MPNLSRAALCVRTGDIKRYKDIFVNAFQYRLNKTLEMYWNDTSAYVNSIAGSTLFVNSTAVTVGQKIYTNANIYIITTAGNTGTAAPSHTSGTAIMGAGATAQGQWVTSLESNTLGNVYTGLLNASVVQATSAKYKFYSNINNTGFLFSSSQGRVIPANATANFITQSTDIDITLNDWVDFIVSTPLLAGSTFTITMTDSLNNTSVATATIPDNSSVYRVIYKPNLAGVQASNGNAIGVVSNTVTTPLINIRKIRITGSTVAGADVTVYATYFSPLQNNFPGSVLTGTICCLDEITPEISKDTNDRICNGVVVGKIVTKEERKWTLKVTELDLYAQAIFSGAVATFANSTIGTRFLSGNINGTGLVNIGSNKQIQSIEIEGQVMQKVNNSLPATLDYNQYTYNSTTGDVQFNNTYYANRTPTIRIGSTQNRLALAEKATQTGYLVYVEIPEFYENGEKRTKAFYGEIAEFKADVQKDNDTIYEIVIIENPDADGYYNTFVE